MKPTVNQVRYMMRQAINNILFRSQVERARAAKFQKKKKKGRPSPE